MAVLTPIARIERTAEFAWRGYHFLEDLCARKFDEDTTAFDELYALDLFDVYPSSQWKRHSRDPFSGDRIVEVFGRSFSSYHMAIAETVEEAFAILIVLSRNGRLPKDEIECDEVAPDLRPFDVVCVDEIEDGVAKVIEMPNGRAKLIKAMSLARPPFLLRIGPLEFSQECLKNEYEHGRERASQTPRPTIIHEWASPGVDWSTANAIDVFQQISDLAEQVRYSAEGGCLPSVAMLRELRDAGECIDRLKGGDSCPRVSSPESLAITCLKNGIYGALAQIARTLGIDSHDFFLRTSDDDKWKYVFAACDGATAAIANAGNSSVAEPPTRCVYHGDRRIDVGERSLTLTDREDRVVAPLVKWRTLDLTTLADKANIRPASKAADVLRSLRKKYGGALAPYFFMPGGNAKGGYSTTCRSPTSGGV